MLNNDIELDDLPPRRRRVPWLAVAALITVILWQMPFGGLLLYPFTILATWFHEMGHGLTAMLLGGAFKQLLIYPNGSGIAVHTSSGGLREALVAAGGLLGPPIAGALFILSGRSPHHSRLVLGLLGLALLISTLIWVRTPFGWAILPITGLILLGIAGRAPDWLPPIVVQFMGVQACISTYRQLDYLFMHSANVGGRQMLSDTGQIAEVLILPYWFWGGLIAVASFMLLIWSLFYGTKAPDVLPPVRRKTALSR